MAIKSKTSLVMFRERSNGLTEQLEKNGISLYECPLISFIPISSCKKDLRDCWKRLLEGEEGYLLFTSGRAVEYFVDIVGIDREGSTEKGRNIYKKIDRIISVGSSTSNLLEKTGLSPTYRVETFSKTLNKEAEGQKGVWQLIHSKNLNPIIHVRGVRINNFLEKTLSTYGYEYQGFPVYKSVQLLIGEDIKDMLLKQDYLFFSSGSIVESFYTNFKERYRVEKPMNLPTVILIGNSTKETYEQLFKMRKWDCLLKGDPSEELLKRIVNTVKQIEKHK